MSASTPGDVSVALSRPMDVSITNRLPGEIAEIAFLKPPYVRATFNLGETHLHALITRESGGAPCSRVRPSRLGDDQGRGDLWSRTQARLRAAAATLAFESKTPSSEALISSRVFFEELAAWRSIER